MSQTSKGRAVEVVCPYCQNADRSLIEEVTPRLGKLGLFRCEVCSKTFVIEGAKA